MEKINIKKDNAYTLMHKNIRVADIEIDIHTGVISKIKNLYNIEHLPLGVRIQKNSIDRASLNNWWLERSIPSSRSGIKDALTSLGLSTTCSLLTKSYGLSLSDQYWVCPENSYLEWSKVNFFYNDFADDIGNVLFGKKVQNKVLDFSSPDNTSDGNLKKRWKIINKKRCLIKGGSNPFRQQPFNEVIADKIMTRLGIDHISYETIWDGGFPYSICEDFITADTELIPAWRIMQARKKKSSDSVYKHFLDCCEFVGIKRPVQFLNQMIVLDFIIANEDRHFNNFGAIRNAETLEWIGMAPIYDSGSSLGYDKLPNQIRSEKDIVCKPFKNHHKEQLNLVNDFSWIDFEQLKDIDSLIRSVFDEKSVEFVDETRMQAICYSTNKRINYLKEYAASYSHDEHRDNTENDVTVNEAQTYSA